MSTQELVKAPSVGFGFGPEGGSYLRFGLGPGELEGSLPIVLAAASSFRRRVARSAARVS